VEAEDTDDTDDPELPQARQAENRCRESTEPDFDQRRPQDRNLGHAAQDQEQAREPGLLSVFASQPVSQRRVECSVDASEHRPTDPL
jgi:hypothetical protein